MNLVAGKLSTDNVGKQWTEQRYRKYMTPASRLCKAQISKLDTADDMP
jgi:hypothetical protein